MGSRESLQAVPHAAHRHAAVWNSGLVITNSPIHGRGVFVARTFEPGDSVAQLSGRLIRGSQAQSDPNYIGIGPDAWIDPDLPFSTINHSCEPSAAFGRRRFIYALRRLEPGSEVTIDYSTTEVDIDWEMRCACGARNCRGTLRAMQYSFQDLFLPPVASPLMLRVWRNRLTHAALAR